MFDNPLDYIFKSQKIEDNIWLPALGNPKAKLLLVISHPGKDDTVKGQILSGPVGIEIQNAIEAAGIDDANDVYITTMVKYDIGSASKPTSKQIAECAAMLEFEIKLIEPKLIMTLGADPFKAVMQQNAKVTDSLGEVIDSPYGKLLPNYSAGMILTQDPTQRPFFREVFELAQNYITDNLTYTSFDWLVVDQIDVAKEVIQHYLDKLEADPTLIMPIGYDGEWKGNKFTDDEVLYTFQFSIDAHKAIIFDISKDGKTENLELLMTLKPLLEHPRVDRLGWNIRADDKRLRLRGIIPLESTIGCDGMKLCGFIDSRWGKGLETGIKKFTTYKPYYNDLNFALKAAQLKKHEMADVKFLNPAVFWEYCAGDAVAHRTACLAMREHFKKKFPKTQVDYYFNTYLPLSNYFLDLEMEGIPIDLQVMEDVTRKYTDKYNELYEKLKELVRPLGFDSVRKQALEDVEKGSSRLDEDFNPRSSHHKCKLLYDILRLDPPYYTKPPKAAKPREWWIKQKPPIKKQYNPSANGKSISTLKFDLSKAALEDPDNQKLQDKLEIVATLLSLNRVGVFAMKFFNKKGTSYHRSVLPTEDCEEEHDEEEVGEGLKSSYWNALHLDGKIHPDFFECLSNFRSSSKPNVQNPASKVLSHIPDIFIPGYANMPKEAKNEADKLALIPRNPRHIFHSGDPDWYWAEVDVAGADLAIAAFLSDDKDYITDILKGNFHLAKAKEYFRNPNITKDDTSAYVTAKSITFRVAYTSELMSAAIPIQAEIYAESGIYVEMNKIEYALGTWKRYGKYMNFRESCKKQVTELRYIENMRGIRYYFEETENFGIIAGWMNESLAYPIASELALFLWDVSVSIKKQLQNDNLWMRYIKPVNSVHDAAYWNVHKDLMQDNYFPELCKHFFTKQCKIVTGDNLGMEMVVADRWKGKEKIFAKETTWNFAQKCWDWKVE